MSGFTGVSPIQKLRKNRNGNEVYVMRDDLLPFSLGGNKVRIAEEFFRDMEEKNCDTMIAYGNARSNLCRVIANECKIRKMPCYIINSTEDYEEEQAETSNSSLMRLLGAVMIPCRKDQIAETVERTMKEIEEKGGRPYYIFGNKFGTGNEATAAGAYAKAYDRIRDFEQEQDLEFDYIFHASGTGATQTGLICGHLLAGDRKKIVGILISSREYERAVSIIRTGVEKYLERLDKPFLQEYNEEIHVETEFRKGGYGLYNQEILDCIRDTFCEESIPLDPVYTGKAFWGMQQYLKQNRIENKKILFIHTGGTPLFFDCLKKGELK